MNAERAQMRVKLANLNQRQKRLEMHADELCTTIRANLNTALTEIGDLLVPETAGQMDELVAVWGELQAVRSEIARLERELA